MGEVRSGVDSTPQKAARKRATTKPAGPVGAPTPELTRFADPPTARPGADAQTAALAPVLEDDRAVADTPGAEVTSPAPPEEEQETPAATGGSASSAPPRRLGTSRATTGIVLALIALQLLYRWIISRPGYYWQDDYYINAWAQANPLGLRYLLLPFSDHFQPVGLAIAWLSQRMFPGSYDASMIWTGALYAASMWVLFRLLVRIFGWRTQFYLLIVVLGFSSLTLQGYLWHSVSIWLAPLTFFTLLTLLVSWNYVLAPRWWRLVLVLVVTTITVGTHEFSVFVPVLLLGMLAAIPHTAGGRSLGLRAVTTYWKLWVVQALPFVMLAAFYLTKPRPLVPLVWSTDNVFQFVWRMLGSAIAPSLVGGPWRYNGYLSPEWPVFTPFGVIVAVELTLLALIVVPLAKRRSGWLWLVCLGVVVAELAVIAYGRSSDGVGAVVMRYGGAALVPLIVAAAYSMAVTPLERRGWRTRAAPAVAAWRRTSTVTKGAVVVVLTQVFAASAAISLQVPVLENPVNVIRPYVENGVRTFGDIPRGTAVVPQFVPGFVIGGARAPAPSTTQIVFGGIPGSPRFANSVAGDLYGFSDQGFVVKQFVRGADSRPGPNGDCGYLVEGRPVVIKLNRRAEYGFATGDLGVLGQRATTATVELLDGGVVRGVSTIDVPAGLERVYFPLPGVGDSVRISPAPGAVFCATDLRVGERFHLDNGTARQDGSSAFVYDYALSS